MIKIAITKGRIEKQVCQLLQSRGYDMDPIIHKDRELLIETITQCQPYIGFPRTLNAIAIINEVTK